MLWACSRTVPSCWLSISTSYKPVGTYRRPCQRLARQGPAWAVVDGQSALGMVGCHFALELAMTKAKNCGVGYVGLRNTAHVGAIGYYAAQAARRGFIAMITGNDIPSVAAPGSRAAILAAIRLLTPFRWQVATPSCSTWQRRQLQAAKSMLLISVANRFLQLG